MKRATWLMDRMLEPPAWRSKCRRWRLRGLSVGSTRYAVAHDWEIIQNKPVVKITDGETEKVINALAQTMEKTSAASQAAYLSGRWGYSLSLAAKVQPSRAT
jgi:hypothetical protein